MLLQSAWNSKLLACLPIAAALGFSTMPSAAEIDPSMSTAEQAPLTQPAASDKQTAPKKTPKRKSSGKKTLKKKPVEAQPPQPEEPLGAMLNMTDAPRDYLSEKFVGFVSRVDRFFGDDRNFQESNDSVLQIDIDRVYGYGSVDKVVVSGRAKIHLPNTEKNLHLLIESDPDTITNADTRRSTAARSGKTAPDSYAAGVRYEKVEEERWHYSSDLGLQFQGLHTTPFVRGRVSYAQPVEEWRLKATETLFWFYSTGPGETTQFDMDRTLNDSLHFRSSSIATWLHEPQNMDLQQSFTWFHTLNKRTALIYQASAFAVTQPYRQVTDTVLLLGYRYRLHREWIYFDVSPQLHFPKDKQYRASPALLLRLEMLFDKAK